MRDSIGLLAYESFFSLGMMSSLMAVANLVDLRHSVVADSMIKLLGLSLKLHGPTFLPTTIFSPSLSLYLSISSSLSLFLSSLPQ